MKKIFMMTAVATMLLASCTNEIVDGNENEGQLFTLEVTQGTDSRTTLSPNSGAYQTLWSEGDEIFVTSEDGKTTGVLTLMDGFDESSTGKFSGYVFGNGTLTKAIFPVPSSNNVIDLSKRSADEIDAPMVGTISGTSTTLENKAAIIKLNIANLPENSTLTISGDNIISNATWNGTEFVNGTANEFVITGADDMEDIFVPVFVRAGANATPLSIKVGNGAVSTLPSVALATNKVSVNVPTLVYSNGTLMTPGDQGSNASILTPSNLTSTFYAEEGQTYLLEGDFNNENVFMEVPANVYNVIFDGTKATNINELIIKQGGNLIDNPNDPRITSNRNGKLTIKNFRDVASQINVVANSTEIEIYNNKAEALGIFAGNIKLNIHDNSFDANFESHGIYMSKTQTTGGANNYGVKLRIFNYDLWFDNNTVTNSASHVVGINGYQATFNIAVDNKIHSFTGNNITVNSTTNINRAAFKIWADHVYAPQTLTNDVNDASQEFINDVLANGENTFDIVDGYNHTIFCIYNVNTDK